MAAWILSEHKLMGSISSQKLYREEHQIQKEVLEEQQMCRRFGANTTMGITPLPKLQVTVTSHG